MLVLILYLFVHPLFVVIQQAISVAEDPSAMEAAPVAMAKTVVEEREDTRVPAVPLVPVVQVQTAQEAEAEAAQARPRPALQPLVVAVGLGY